MASGQENSDKSPTPGGGAGGPAIQPAKPDSQFKRQLVPLDEYAARRGLSGETVEKQGQLGVVQIRKFKGQKFVVDVPFNPSALSDDEPESDGSAIRRSRPKPAAARQTKVKVQRRWSAGAVIVVFLLMAGLCAAVWLYVDARMKLDNLDMEYMTLRMKYDDIVHATENTGTVQSELSASRAELGRIQSQVGFSRAQVEKIQGSLSRARRDLETIQGELAGIQSRISLSRAEIENVQNDLNSSKSELDTLYQRNIEFAGDR